MEAFSSRKGRIVGASAQWGKCAHWARVAGISGLYAALLVVSFAGCGRGQGSFQNGIYQGPETKYSLGAIPTGWRQVSVERQSDLAWAHDAYAAVMHVDSGCSRSMDVPLTALTNHLLIGFTDREVVSEELVQMDGREALRTHMMAKLDGVPRELLIQVLKKDGCVYDFALVAPVGAPFAKATADFDSIIADFQAQQR